MRIGVDIDGVLADFNKAFIERVIHVTSKDLFPRRPFDIPTWNYPEHYGYSNAEVAQVWSNIKTDPFFWSLLPAYWDTRSSLEYLGDRIRFGDDVYFITARPGIDAKKQTEMWLNMHWPKAHVPALTVLISSDKDLCAEALELDVYVDDRDLNVQRVAVKRNWEQQVAFSKTFDEHTRVFLLNRPWNEGFNEKSLNITRVNSIVGIATVFNDFNDRAAA